MASRFLDFSSKPLLSHLTASMNGIAGPRVELLNPILFTTATDFGQTASRTEAHPFQPTENTVSRGDEGRMAPGQGGHGERFSGDGVDLFCYNFDGRARSQAHLMISRGLIQFLLITSRFDQIICQPECR
jgi:hypothetical protein